MLGRRRASDAGFTLIETLVSVSVIAIVMAALTAFFTSTLHLGDRQGMKQTAIQLANDGVDRTRALRGSSVHQGRDAVSTNQQWTNGLSGKDAVGKPLPGIAPYLKDMAKAPDPMASSGAGATATLPTSPTPSVVNGVTYDRSWYVGSCWQLPDGGPCGLAPATGTDGYVPFFRVVVAVSWTDKKCAGGICSYVTATLVSAAGTEPVFTSVPGTQPPRAKTPGPQEGIVGDAVTLQLTSSGGLAPLTWSVVGLPPGLSMTSGGRITGTLTTAGSYSVTVTVTDALNAKSSATFPWTVSKRLTVTAPAAQVSTQGAAVTPVPLTATAGLAPYAWSATGLPPGLSLGSATGRVTGTPTKAGSYPVTVTVTDAGNAKGTATFTWTVNPPLVLGPVSAQTGSYRASASFDPKVTGGTAPYSWSATGLPAGLAVNPATGQVAGIPEAVGTYSVTMTVTDAAGATSTIPTFTWSIR